MRKTFAALLVASLCSTSLADLASDYASRVTQASYAGYLEQSLFTRYGNNRKFATGSNRIAARDNILAQFSGLGLQASLESFTYSGSTGWNVVGVLPGRVTPQNVYLVGAHMDSSNSSGAGSGATAGAPGADDNASGTAGVMEAAKALAGNPFESTIVFVAFDAEELGLIGSKRYVTTHAGQSIKAAIAMDMIAYNPQTNQNNANLYYKYAATGQSLADGLSQAFTQYSGGVAGTAAQYTTYDMTDHAPFANAGYPAVAVTEAAVWTNPRYHRWQDSIDTTNYIDTEYGARITRGVAGYVANAAGALQPGDANLDDAVDFADLLIVAQGYGTLANGTWQTGDFTGEGAIDFADALVLAQAYGIGTTQLTTNNFDVDWPLARSLVPEPAAALLLLLGTPLTRTRR